MPAPRGFRFLPIDITKSDWDCTIEDMKLRLGLRYVKGLRAETGLEIVRQRIRAPFANIDDIPRRVQQLNKEEMTTLASTGTLNSLNAEHRRDALWKSAFAMEDGVIHVRARKIVLLWFDSATIPSHDFR